MLSAKSIKSLEEMLTKKSNAIKESLDSRRTIMQTVDKYLQKETDRTETGIQGKIVNELGDKGKIRDTEVPIVRIQHQTALAYLTGLFLGGEPIFAATANRQHEDVAAMLTALSQRDQHRLNWRGNLIRALDFSLRYNLAPVEVFWGNKRASSVTTVQASEGSTQTGELSPVVYEGNIMRALDPYNVFFDTTVNPYEVHEHGMFAGYVEKFNYLRMKKFFHELTNTFVIKRNVKDAFGRDANLDLHFTPLIRRIHAEHATDDWEAFFGNEPSIDPHGSKGKYEVITLYTRLIPREYNLDMPRPGHLKTFKLIYVNGVLLYAEPLNTPHEFLPLIIGQLEPGPMELKSFAEFVTDLQDLGTSMIRGTMSSMRRAVSDRAIYDPTRVRKNDVDSPNPVAKIPVTTNAYQTDIRTAYFPIPYTDTVTPLFQNNFGLIMSLADQTTGQNQATQGSFMRGNKTMFEFDEIMSNAQARVKLGAVHLETTLFHPIKETIKLNYLLYSQTEEIDDNITNQPVQIDPVMLRKFAPQFKMADGVLPTTKVANTEILMQALQLMSSNPEMQLEWSVPGITISVLKQQGFHDLDAYKRTPEEQQRIAALMGMMQGNQQPPAEGQ
jgi:hypothetical protein